MPEPLKPIWPATRDRFSRACALAVPLMCWVMPMPQIRQEPAKGGRAYQRAAWAMASCGTPVSDSARSSV
jgi:hypothetical protein